MAFIDRHWQPGHALARSRALLDWQHGTPDGSLDYLVAMRDKDVLGVLGYIVSRRFDPALSAENALWLALWKVRDDAGVAGLGLRMLGSLARDESHVTMAVSGIHAALLPMYRALGYQTGELRRFYVTNPAQPRALLEAPPGARLPVPCAGQSRLVEMGRAELESESPMAIARDIANPKTPRYFASRFLDHPFYRYRVFRVAGPSHGPGLLATRVARHLDARALRVVDFAGDPAAIASMGSAIGDLMHEEGAEYADFWQLGLGAEQLEAAGFCELDPDGAVVLPNYFEPFLKKNGRILYALRTKTGRPAVICRADGDQDRPSLLPTPARADTVSAKGAKSPDSSS
jgi:hypothetical protein